MAEGNRIKYLESKHSKPAATMSGVQKIQCYTQAFSAFTIYNFDEGLISDKVNYR